MNNSSYVNYGRRILYKIDSYRFQIPAKSIPHIEIQQLDTITWAPKQVKEKVDMNTYSIFNEDLSLIGLINKARPNIHNPHNISVDVGITADTKESRLGTTTSALLARPQRFSFARGINTSTSLRSFVAVTPTGTNVNINVPPQNERSLAFSATFQQVTTPGTTNLYEFTSTINGVPGYKGIQIDTTAGFIGDIYFSFVLPQNISLTDFENLSLTNTIDDTDITVSRNYPSRTIQGKISYTQAQGSMAIQAGPTTLGGIVVTGPEECTGDKSDYCSYWVWYNKDRGSGLDEQSIFGQYIRGCYKPCVGYGNTRLSNDECKCKCPPAESPGQGVYNNPNTGAHVCFDCGLGKEISSLDQTPFYECKCLNDSCRSNSNSLAVNNSLNYKPNPGNCNCECKPGRAKCGSKRIFAKTISLFLDSNNTVKPWEYSYTQDICCEPGQVCVNGECKPAPLCACINKGPYAPPSSWILLMAVAGDGVFTLDSGSVSSVSSEGNVTLNGLKSFYRRPGGSPIAPNTRWYPNTTLILYLNCGGYNPYQLGLWDNYGQSTNPELPAYGLSLTEFFTGYDLNRGAFNTFVNRCGSEELIDVTNITSQTVCNQTASNNPEQLISWKCGRARYT